MNAKSVNAMSVNAIPVNVKPKQVQGGKTICNALGKLTLLGGALVSLNACKTEEITYVSFYPGGGTYAEAQSVSVQLPPKATNVYLTTDSIDPVADARCGYSGEAMTLDRPTLVKVAYDVVGKHYQAEALYVIENNTPENGFTNRKVINTWERFFVDHVLRQFSVPNENTSVITLNDDQGGKVTVTTDILSRSMLGAPTKGDQTYVFDNFNMKDAETGEEVTISQGKISGYRDQNEGSYTTLLTGVRGSGKRLEFSGTYNGWADGDFLMNAAGETTSGYYKVYCQDNGCSVHPMVYALTTNNRFVEVAAYPDGHTRSCTDPVPQP